MEKSRVGGGVRDGWTVMLAEIKGMEGWGRKEGWSDVKMSDTV